MFIGEIEVDENSTVVLSREHLMSHADIHNIMRRYGLIPGKKHANDAISVEL